ARGPGRGPGGPAPGSPRRGHGRGLGPPPLRRRRRRRRAAVGVRRGRAAMTGGAPRSVVGVLPALGSGLTDLRRTGQHDRLLDYDLRHYARAYDCVYYWSYFDEALADFTRDPLLLANVVLLSKPPP